MTPSDPKNARMIEFVGAMRSYVHFGPGVLTDESSVNKFLWQEDLLRGIYELAVSTDSSGIDLFIRKFGRPVISGRGGRRRKLPSRDRLEKELATSGRGAVSKIARRYGVTPSAVRLARKK